MIRLRPLCMLLVLLPAIACAQNVTPSPQRWLFQTSVVATGTSLESEPEGYKVYTALAFEVGVRRELGRHLAFRLTGALESREVEFLPDSPLKTNLGSLELLPVNAVVEWHPRSSGAVRPYVGGGLNLSVFWEKSGTLDSVSVSQSVGPTLAAGLEFPLSPTALLIVGYKWNSLSTDLEKNGAHLARLKIDPSTFGLGLAFRF